MNINQEIEKAEMKVQKLIKDWQSQKLVSFIDDLIKNDRIEQLKLCGVGVTLVCDDCKEHNELKYCEECYHDDGSAM